MPTFLLSCMIADVGLVWVFFLMGGVKLSNLNLKKHIISIFLKAYTNHETTMNNFILPVEFFKDVEKAMNKIMRRLMRAS